MQAAPSLCPHLSTGNHPRRLHPLGGVAAAAGRRLHLVIRVRGFLCTLGSRTVGLHGLLYWGRSRQAAAAGSAAAAGRVAVPPTALAAAPCRQRSPWRPAPLPAARWPPRQQQRGRPRRAAPWAPWTVPWTACRLVQVKQQQRHRQMEAGFRAAWTRCPPPSAAHAALGRQRVTCGVWPTGLGIRSQCLQRSAEGRAAQTAGLPGRECAEQRQVRGGLRAW